MSYRTLSISLSTSLFTALLLGACSGPKDNVDDMGSSEPSPENLVDMGPEPDTSSGPLGELCHVKVQVSSDTQRAVPTVEAYDLTADRPIEILDRSSPGNHYFDAPLDHEVEITVQPGAGAPVAPLTHRATVNTRCASIGDVEFFTPLGLTLAQTPLDASPDDQPGVFFDPASGVMIVRGPERWHAIGTTDNPNFAPQSLVGDPAFAELPATTFFRSLPSGHVLAEADDTVIVFASAPGSLTEVTQESIPTPLRHLEVVDAQLAVAHAADGSVWEVETGTATQPSAAWRVVATEPQLSISIGDAGTWMIDDAGLVRRAAFGEAPVDIGTLAGAAGIVVNAAETRVLAVLGSACEPWIDRCDVALMNAADLSPVQDMNGEPVGASNVLAASSVGDAFVLASAPSAVRLLHLEDDELIEGEALSGAPDAERSMVLPGALVVVTDQQTTFARTSTDSAAYEEGNWTVLPRNDGYIELVETPCEDPLTCERVLWNDDLRSRTTAPGSTLKLGPEFEITPEWTSDAYQRIDFIKDDLRAPTSWSVTIEPYLVPSGVPCIPIIDTTVAVERFTPAAKALHCITWWGT